jgi:hypothetical protein
MVADGFFFTALYVQNKFPVVGISIDWYNFIGVCAGDRFHAGFQSGTFKSGE